MKSTVPLRKLFAPTLKVVRKETPLVVEQKQTPYLRAILSATPSPINAERKINLSTPDLNAALRYIKESAFLKK